MRGIEFFGNVRVRIRTEVLVNGLFILICRSTVWSSAIFVAGQALVVECGSNKTTGLYMSESNLSRNTFGVAYFFRHFILELDALGLEELFQRLLFLAGYTVSI